MPFSTLDPEMLADGMFGVSVVDEAPGALGMLPGVAGEPVEGVEATGETSGLPLETVPGAVPLGIAEGSILGIAEPVVLASLAAGDDEPLTPGSAPRAPEVLASSSLEQLQLAAAVINIAQAKRISGTSCRS